MPTFQEYCEAKSLHDWVYKFLTGKEHPVKLEWASVKELAGAINSEKDDISRLTEIFVKQNWGRTPQGFSIEDIQVKSSTSNMVEVLFVYSINRKPAEKATMKFFPD